MTKLFKCILLSLLSQSYCALLRRKLDNEGERFTISNESFDCDVYELDGMSEPNSAPIEPEFICIIEGSATQGRQTFFFDGDIEAQLGQQIDPNLGSTSLTVPWDAVGIDNTISTNHPGIVIYHNPSSRHLATKKGVHKVLIIRVVANDVKPINWKKDLVDGFFNQEENNLVTRYKACSNGHLKIIPATGPSGVVNKGIINIRLSGNIAGKNYMSVSDTVSSKLNEITGIDYTSKIMILPNEVDFRGGAAWAALNGNTIWVHDQFAKFPMVQIHEYGHLLGMHHSGKGDKTYADNTGYMGNQLPWNEDGAITCFNPAKTWYLGWYSWRHITVNPTQSAFNDNLVSLDDVVNSNAGVVKMIVRVIGDQNEFFIMFNRAKGVNEGAVGYRDQVVITQQNSESSVSYVMAGLGDGQYWTYDNFGGTNKRLVIKNCYTSSESRDTAKVLIYIQGQNDQSCSEQVITTAESGWNEDNNVSESDNVDSCQSFDWWFDSDGPKYNCLWYAEIPTRCPWYGHKFEKFDMVANEACCECGGGMVVNNESKR